MDNQYLVLVFVILGVASVLYIQKQTSSTSVSFESWKAKYGIKYDNHFEDQYREKIFLRNLAEIEAHNANEYKTYKKGINQFTALSREEFAQTYLGFIAPENYQNIENGEDISVGDVDWVSKGAVTDIKDQGQCESCWSFSTTGALEGLSKITTGSLQNFSEQQLIDCSFLIYYTHGCAGGTMDNAFKYVIDRGIIHEDLYPYVAALQTCKHDGGPFKISGYTDVKSCTDLAIAANKGPISVAVDANDWADYGSGIFDNCGNKLDHGVLLVGLTAQYWKVKNSWGKSWGESGYIRLARGNTCGICNLASYPYK